MKLIGDITNFADNICKFLVTKKLKIWLVS